MMMVLILLNVFSIFVCGFIAKYRRANVVYWGLLGALLGPLAIPLVCFAKPHHE